MFTGKELDDTGLYYYGARYYDSEVGRFITRDTWPGEIRDPQSLNGYIYCKNNPVKYIDQWGNFALPAAVGFLKVISESLGALGALTSLSVLIPVVLIAVIIVLVAVVVYKIYQNGKEQEMAGIEKETRNTPLSQFGAYAKITYNKESCEVSTIVVYNKDGTGAHFTFWKDGDKWYYHPPGQEDNIMLCPDNVARALESLKNEAELECSGATPREPTSPDPYLILPPSGESEGEHAPSEPNQAF